MNEDVVSKKEKGSDKLALVAPTSLSRRTRALIAVSLLGIITTVVVLVFRGTPEPKYQGVGLSKWLDGTMAKPEPKRMREVMRSVGPEALPWLFQAAEGEPQFRYVLYRKYAQLYRSSSIVRWLLPKPGPDLSHVAHYNALLLLSRLAPGTAYEERSLSAILGLRQPTSKPNSFEVECGMLSQFTNYPNKVLPTLLISLTNTRTVDSAILAFQRFGTSATPVLYPVALSETGFVRPAELALKKSDPAAYEKLLAEKAH